MSSPLLAVEDAGRGETLILLHGLATSSVIWEASLPALARGRRVLTVDLPGFGGSAPAGADFELKVVAERIARGIAARGFRGPVDLGYRIGLTWRSCRSSLRFVTLGSLFGPGVAELGRFRALRYARPIRARPRWCGGEARRPRPDRRRNEPDMHKQGFLDRPMPSSPHHRDHVRLAYGRRLVFAITGPADGVPIVYCHRAIGTPLGPSVDLESITFDLEVRYLAVSRPGIGGSDPAPGRTVLNFASDLAKLVDALSIPQFAVVGVSAGGPYALAIL